LKCSDNQSLKALMKRLLAALKSPMAVYAVILAPMVLKAIYRVLKAIYKAFLTARSVDGAVSSRENEKQVLALSQKAFSAVPVRPGPAGALFRGGGIIPGIIGGAMGGRPFSPGTAAPGTSRPGIGGCGLIWRDCGAPSNGTSGRSIPRGVGFVGGIFGGARSSLKLLGSKGPPRSLDGVLVSSSWR
jgi:hypothetical protein